MTLIRIVGVIAINAFHFCPCRSAGRSRGITKGFPRNGKGFGSVTGRVPAGVWKITTLIRFSPVVKGRYRTSGLEVGSSMVIECPHRPCAFMSLEIRADSRTEGGERPFLAWLSQLQLKQNLVSDIRAQEI